MVTWVWQLGFTQLCHKVSKNDFKVSEQLTHFLNSGEVLTRICFRAELDFILIGKQHSHLSSAFLNSGGGQVFLQHHIFHISSVPQSRMATADHADCRGWKKYGRIHFHWENGLSWDKIHSKSMKAYVRVIWTCQKLFSWSTPIRINPNWTTRKLPVGLILFGLGLPPFGLGKFAKKEALWVDHIHWGRGEWGGVAGYSMDFL